jgi:hypothetical protein
LLASEEDQRKWTPNYERSYVVKKAFSEWALILTNMDGDDLLRHVNSDIVNKYYALSTLTTNSKNFKFGQEFFGIFSLSLKKNFVWSYKLKNFISMPSPRFLGK